LVKMTGVWDFGGSRRLMGSHRMHVSRLWLGDSWREMPCKGGILMSQSDPTRDPSQQNNPEGGVQ